MKHFYTTLLFIFIGTSIINAQTTVYETGQNSSDAWTGWSTPVTTGILGQSINGINIYNFNTEASGTYSIEITRQFNINSTDIDVYLNATTQNSTVELLYSSNNTTWTSMGNVTSGATFGLQTLIVPTYNPIVTSFYLKIKITGTIGTQLSATINSLKIDADLNLPIVGLNENSIDYKLIYSNNQLIVDGDISNYKVSIYDMLGKIIVSENNLKFYDFNNFNNGIYFVTLTLKSGERKTIKVFKQ